MEALILEKEPLALGAYSTRILRRDYQRALMRVRRLADSAQADVRADANGVISLSSRIKVASGSSSATTLGEFVANSAYTDVDSLGGPTGATVTIWYDQSGSNKHMTQTVTNYQPRIVSSSGGVYQAENSPNVLFWPSTPNVKYMDIREMNGEFTVHLGFRLLGAGTSVKMYDASADTFEISRSSNTISLTNVTSSVTTLNGYNKGSATTIDFSGASDSFVTISGTFSSTGTARIGGDSGGVTDLYIYPRAKDGKRTKKVEAIQSRERSTPLAFSNRQDLDETAFLNTFQGAASAFSLRDLNGSESTKLITVRRDADNKEIIVFPDDAGYVSLESPVITVGGEKTTGVTVTPSVSSSTLLGQFLGDSSYSDPDSLGAPSNGYVVEMFDQVAQNEASGRRLLDYHTNAEAAYSFKRLRTDYTGPAFQVVLLQGGDTNEFIVETKDIEFDSTGNSFFPYLNYYRQKYIEYAGGGGVFAKCSKWYDQSGNGRDLVQSAAFEMPFITYSYYSKNGELALLQLNNLFSMSATGLNISTPYSYNFSFDQFNPGDCDIFSFDTDVSVGISSGNVTITSESNTITGGAVTLQNAETVYGVHDGASSEIGLDGIYTSGTGASKAASSINLFPSTGFFGSVYEFILWGENKSSDIADKEDIDLYSKNIYRTVDQNALSIPATAQPKIYDATNGLITDGGRAAMDVVSGNYFLFDRAKIAGESTVSSFASFSTSDTRGSLYGLEGGYRGPYLNPSYTASGTFLSNFGTPSHFLNGEAETISSSADGSTAISDGVKNVYSLINADASSWTAAGTNDITLFNFNSAASSSDTLIGKYQEFIFFTSDVSEQRESIESNINNAFSGFSSASSRRIPKLLNNFPSAAAAYSVRQINSNYTGPLMRIDNGFTELDIYPLSNGDLDVESILEHASVSPTGNAGVAVWYDQSGNGNDAVQAANSSQPRIAINNAIVYENGKPALDFDGSDDKMSSGNVQSNTTDTSLVFVGSRDTVLASNSTVSYHTGGEHALAGFYSDEYFLQSGSSYASGSGAVGTDQHVYSHHTNGNDYEFFINGINVYAGTHSLATGTSNLEIGSFVGTYLFSGTMQEIAIFSRNQSANRKEIESNINKYFDITPESPKLLLLDKVKEDAAAAYSLRKLRSKYTGPAVRVRRDADDVEVDVYFDTNGEVSLKSRVVNTTETTIGKPQGGATFTLGAQTLGEFVGDSTYVSGGAKNAFVVCWYDQSHNGKDATQNTAANQPKLYDSVDGLVVENGKPALQFDGANYSFDTSWSAGNTSAFTAFNIASPANNTTASQLYDLRDANDDGLRLIMFSDANLFYSADADDLRTTAYISGQQLVYSNYANSTIATGIDGATVDTGSAPASISVTANTTLFRDGTANTFYFNGKAQEAIFYDSDQSSNRTKIESDINDHYSIYQGSPEPKLLNSYSGAAAAYSLRVLDNIYTGPLVRVRRDSDNIEMDVYPDHNGVLSERSVVKNKVETSTGVTVGTPNDSRAFTFGEFAYGTNCYVVEWKDQSGNANHATQNTAANQPKIYDSVTGVVTDNGKPACDFAGSGIYLSASSSMNLGTNDHLVTGAINVGTGGSNPVWFEEHAASLRYVLWRQSSNSTLQLYHNAVIGSGIASTDNQQYLVTATRVGTTSTLHVDSTNSTTGTASDFVSSGTLKIGINSTVSVAASWAGKIQEIIAYASDQSANRTNIEENINTFYNIY